jgi:nickel/cobalt exporter
MTPLAELLQQGASHAWLFIPSAVLLGALHGLEPGHSKTMMAAFIIAVRGTVTQAILLGLAATVSHTAVVWAVALIGMLLGSQWNAEATEPYFQVASAVLIIGIAVWMLWRTWREQQRIKLEAYDHHHHGEEMRRIDTGHGVLSLEVFEDGVPPRWRIHTESGHGWPAQAVTVETARPDVSGDVNPRLNGAS